jgi:hypothetical protein
VQENGKLTTLTLTSNDHSGSYLISTQRIPTSEYLFNSKDFSFFLPSTQTAASKLLVDKSEANSNI